MVLADAVMTGMDGPNLVAECRRRWPDLPVIIFTTFDDATIIRRSLTAGAGVLSSPEATKSSKWYILMNTNQTGRIIVDLKEPFLTAWVNDDCCA